VAAGLAEHGLEAVRAGGGDGGREARPQGVQAPEGDRGARAIHAQRRSELAARDPAEQRTTERDVQRGIVGEAVAEEVHLEPTVSVRRDRSRRGGAAARPAAPLTRG
jgi:hypothetical protein